MSAKAADDSALALINSQRAWVMVEVNLHPSVTSLIYSSGSDGVDTAWTRVELRLSNSGPTPAWVFEQWIRLEESPILLASKTEHRFPELPNGSCLGKADRPVPPTQGNYEVIPLVQGGRTFVWETDLRDVGPFAEREKLYPYVYGVIRYRDAFSSMRETYFGYTIRNRNLVRIPSEEFNRHT